MNTSYKNLFGRSLQLPQSYKWRRPFLAQIWLKHSLPLIMVANKTSPITCENHKGGLDWTLFEQPKHYLMTFSQLVSCILPSLVSKAPTCLPTKFSHFAKSSTKSYFHDLSKLSEYQMLVKGTGKIRIYWLQQIFQLGHHGHIWQNLNIKIHLMGHAMLSHHVKSKFFFNWNVILLQQL